MTSIGTVKSHPGYYPSLLKDEGMLEPTVFPIGDRSLYILYEKDVELFHKINGFVQNRIAEKSAELGEKAQYAILSSDEEIRLVKNTFYREQNADALINSIYWLKKFDIVIKYKIDTKGEHPEYDEKRYKFEKYLLRAGVFVERETSHDKKHVFVKIFVPWSRLKAEAKTMRLRFQNREKDNEVLEAKRSKLAQEPSFFEKLQQYLEEEVDVESTYTAFKDDEKVFIGGHEDDRSFIDIVDGFFSSNKRSIIAFTILSKTKLPDTNSKKSGVRYLSFQEMLKKQIYLEYLILHDGPFRGFKYPVANDRALLYTEWVTKFFAKQPFNKIRFYFGEKIALYYAWIGFYNAWMAFAAIVGVVLVILGAFGNTSKQKSASFVEAMDNQYTIIFAFFISVWSTLFQEFWTRKTQILAHNWDVRNLPEDVEVRADFYGNYIRTSPITGKRELFYSPTLRQSKSFVSAMVVLVSAGIVVGSIVTTVILRFTLNGNFQAAVPMVQLAFIMLFSFLYGKVAIKLTDWENHKTVTEYESSLTAKTFVFDAFNNYSSLLYMAFFKDIIGTLNPRLSQEKCQGSCLNEVMLQLAIIFGGKQVINQLLKFVIPWVMRKINRKKLNEEREFLEKTYAENLSSSLRVTSYEVQQNPKFFDPPQWDRDDDLQPYAGPADDYHAMTIQFGFATLFASAFPLAPLFAFINNFFELRIDAYFLTRRFRRPIPYQAKDIGVWRKILRTISTITVITNAFLLAFTSEYVEKQILVPNFPNSLNSDGTVNESAILAGRFAIALIFEFIFSYLVPDIPAAVSVALARQEYLLSVAAGGEPAIDKDEGEIQPLNIICCV